MCGIFGCIGKIEKPLVEKCLKTIAHRGPDDFQIRQIEGATFGHTRLAILDINKSGMQPMCDKHGRYFIVFNGEIYNFLEIKKQLKELGYTFFSDSDTEVALNAFIEWGSDFQNKMNGMWSLAIYDKKEKSLFLSRDRFGVKPLYYYQDKENFYFASEQKALYPVMTSVKINYKLWYEASFFGHEQYEECLISGIKKLQGGVCAQYKEGRLCKQIWWNTLDNLVEVSQNYDEQVEQLRALFLDACRLRMRSDVPIGTALSGGVDSSAVFGAMNLVSTTNCERESTNWKNAFVASMRNTEIDETHFARIAANSVGAKVNEIEIDGNVSPDELMRYLYLCDDPYITSPVTFIQTYKAISQKGIKVTLDGHGADELFAGYHFDMLSAVRDCATEEEKRQILSAYNNTAGKVVENITYDQLLKLSAKNSKHAKEYEQLDYLNNTLYIETHKTTLPTLLRCYDRYSMANGVEIRMPFLDYRIVSFAFSIPYSSKIRDGYNKKIIRDMATPFVCNEIMDRKDKIGFNSPMTQWLRGELKDYIIEILMSKDFKDCELISPIRTQMLYTKLLNKEEPTFSDGQMVWQCVAPYLWKKSVGI